MPNAEGNPNDETQISWREPGFRVLGFVIRASLFILPTPPNLRKDKMQFPRFHPQLSCFGF